MKIQDEQRPAFEKKAVNFDRESTTIYLDILFDEDGKRYHLVDGTIDFDSYDHYEAERHNGNLLINYDYICIEVDDKSLETDKEIAEVVINYLSKLRLYVHNMDILGSKLFISYVSSEEVFDKNLKYSPMFYDRTVFVKVKAQKEDDVDYDEVFNNPIKEAIDSISEEEVKAKGLNEEGKIFVTRTFVMEEYEADERCKNSYYYKYFRDKGNF